MPELTTPELRKALLNKGLNVSHDQLKYWRRNGLLPTPIRRGKGRGKGIEQLWDEACVENVRLILEISKGKRINVINAGRYLFTRNRLVGEKLIRRFLLEISYEMSEAERQIEILANDNSVLIELIQFLTPENVREAIHQTDASKLVYIYDSLYKFDTPIGVQVARIFNCHPVFDVLVQTEFPDLTGITSLSNEAIYRRQRSILAWAMLIDYYGETLNKITTQVIQQLYFKISSYPAMQPIVWPKT